MTYDNVATASARKGDEHSVMSMCLPVASRRRG